MIVGRRRVWTGMGRQRSGSGHVKYWQIIANLRRSLIAGAIAYAASGLST